MLKTEDLLTLVNSGFLREKEMDLWRTAELERSASSRRRWNLDARRRRRSVLVLQAGRFHPRLEGEVVLHQ
jgi:hypothetical protein